MDNRLRPSLILQSSGIPNVRWFDDALKAYGVPIAPSTCHILVPNIEAAAQALEQNKWIRIPQGCGRIGIALLALDEHPQCRFEPPVDQRSADWSPYDFPSKGLSVPNVVLLPAAEWNFTFDKNDYAPTFLPPLEKLVDGLIKGHLDCVNDRHLQDHFGTQLAFMYEYAPDLQQRDFADRLMYEHRQYHFDARAGMSLREVPFVKHQRGIREALRTGTQELQECSGRRDDERLFRKKYSAGARLTPPFPVCE